MSLLDRTDEDLARAVLRRLPRPEVYGLRDQEEEAPVSRGTLARWWNHEYAMKKKTRRKVIDWLEARGVDDVTLDDEQAREAAEEDEGNRRQGRTGTDDPNSG